MSPSPGEISGGCVDCPVVLTRYARLLSGGFGRDLNRKKTTCPEKKIRKSRCFNKQRKKTLKFITYPPPDFRFFRKYPQNQVEGDRSFVDMFQQTFFFLPSLFEVYTFCKTGPTSLGWQGLVWNWKLSFSVRSGTETSGDGFKISK